MYGCTVGDPFTIAHISNLAQYSQTVGDLTPGFYYVFVVVATNQVSGSDAVTSERTLFPETAPAPPVTDPNTPTIQLIRRGLSITISFRNPFSNAYGRIVAFGIIPEEYSVDSNTVNKRQASGELTWAQARRSRPVLEYRTSPDGYFPFTSDSSTETVAFTVGEESCNANSLDVFCNGALFASATYRFKLRAYGADGKFTDTDFSEPFRTGTDFSIFYIPAIIIAVMVVVFLVIFMAMGLGCCGKPGQSSALYEYRDDEGYANGYTNGQANGQANGHMKRSLIGNEYEMESQTQVMESSFSPVPAYTTLPIREETTIMVHPEPKRRNPVKINSFAEHVAKLSANNNSGFNDEYHDLREIGKTRATTVARQDRNVTKNRYRNILPYDYTRVKLSGVVGNDYVNANYIQDDNGIKKYIATQGPLPDSINDFWEMVWENQTGTIVMMTALVEGGKTKCEHYWPASEEPHLYGNVTVTLVNGSHTENYIQRNLILEKEGQQRNVVHYQNTAWTDHGVPPTTDPLVNLVRQVQETSAQDAGPMVVHCSAGVGRTGTFIAADLLIRTVERSTLADFIDVYGTVASLREQRALMVQTLIQYIYLHRTVQTAIEGR